MRGTQMYLELGHTAHHARTDYWGRQHIAAGMGSELVGNV